jgi:hypothetical protein
MLLQTDLRRCLHASGLCDRRSGVEHRQHHQSSVQTVPNRRGCIRKGIALNAATTYLHLITTSNLVWSYLSTDLLDVQDLHLVFYICSLPSSLLTKRIFNPSAGYKQIHRYNGFFTYRTSRRPAKGQIARDWCLCHGVCWIPTLWLW